MKAIVREKAVAHVWTTKQPRETEIRLPKDFKTMETSVLLVDRDEMFVHNRYTNYLIKGQR